MADANETSYILNDLADELGLELSDIYFLLEGAPHSLECATDKDSGRTYVQKIMEEKLRGRLVAFSERKKRFGGNIDQG